MGISVQVKSTKYEIDYYFNFDGTKNIKYDLYNVYKHRSYIQQYGQHFEDSFYLYIISLYFYIASFIRFVRFSPIFLIKDFIYKKYDIGVSIPFEQKRYIENNNIDLEKAFLNIDTSAGGLYNIYPPEILLKYLP